MQPISSTSPEKATVKCSKIHRSQPDISAKIVAFNVLAKLQHTRRSAREISSILEVPNSTMRSWQIQTELPKIHGEVAEFFSTPSGIQFLQQLVTAAAFVIEYGPSGIRGTQEYLRLSGLNQFVALSNGALQAYSRRIEQYNCLLRSRRRKTVGTKNESQKNHGWIR
jgi:hypothetical protein